MQQFKICCLCSVLLIILCLDAGAVTLKIATAAPEGATWMKVMRAGAEEINQRSEGRVRIKFFAGGVMGNDKSVMRKIRIGQLHGGAFVAGSLEEIAKNVNIFSLPLIFRSYEEVVDILHRLEPTQMPESLLERLKRRMAEG